MNTDRAISAAFPFESQFEQVLGSNIHYVDEGDATAAHTFVLLHGNPTSSYLWRNIIPHLTPHGRVIVPDLIGMGKSDKPDIDYTFEQHIAYINGFIEQLGLKNIILVIQDWGSGIGFNYANHHRDNVSGIVFFEAITRPIDWGEMNLPERFLFKRMRHPKRGDKMLIENNFFVERLLPMTAGRKLTQEEMDQYRAPYLNKADRKAVRVWPQQISISGQPAASYRIKQSYAEYLPSSEMPKLMFHAKPGLIIKLKEAEHIKKTWNNIEVVFLGKGRHYLQEQYPHEIGEGIVDWYQRSFT